MTYPPVHQASPTTQVVSGGLASNDIGYLEKVYKAFDVARSQGEPRSTCVGAHPFSRRPRPRLGRPGQALRPRAVRALRRELHRLHGAARRDGQATATRTLPVYITQFGYSTRRGRGPQGRARRASGAVPHPGAQADDLRAVRARSSRGTPCTRRRGTRRSTRCWTRSTAPTRPTRPWPRGAGRSPRRVPAGETAVGEKSPKRSPQQRLRCQTRPDRTRGDRRGRGMGGAGCS